MPLKNAVTDPVSFNIFSVYVILYRMCNIMGQKSGSGIYTYIINREASFLLWKAGPCLASAWLPYVTSRLVCLVASVTSIYRLIKVTPGPGVNWT